MFGASGVDVTGASGGMGAGLDVASIDDFFFHFSHTKAEKTERAVERREGEEIGMGDGKRKRGWGRAPSRSWLGRWGKVKAPSGVFGRGWMNES